MALNVLDGKTRELVTASYAVPDLETAVQQAVYNCIDAHAKTVKLSVGITHASFTAVDDGDGIEPDDLCELIGECYVSSKLPTTESRPNKREQHKTYGFRGAFLHELRSLSAVVEIESRVREQWTSYRKVFQDGAVVFNARSKELRAAPGTKVSVTDLFGKLPVRRKDLSRNKKYRARVIHTIQSFCVSMSMIWPSMSFDIRYEGENVRPVIIPAAKSCRERFVQHFGQLLGNELQYVDFSPDRSLFSIRGYFAFIPGGWEGTGQGIKQAKSYYQFAFLENEWVAECHQLCSRVVTEAALKISSAIPIFILKVSASSGQYDASRIGRKDGVLFKSPEQFHQFLFEFVQYLAATDSSQEKNQGSNRQVSNCCEPLSHSAPNYKLVHDRTEESAPDDFHCSQKRSHLAHPFFPDNRALPSQKNGTVEYSAHDLLDQDECQPLHQIDSQWAWTSQFEEHYYSIEQRQYGSLGEDLNMCHSCGQATKFRCGPVSIDDTEFQDVHVEFYDESSQSGPGAYLLSDLSESNALGFIPQGFAVEGGSADRTEGDLEDIFFSKESYQALMSQDGSIGADAAEQDTDAAKPWLSSKPDAFDCADVLLGMCQDDNCYQYISTLKSNKLTRDGEQNPPVQCAVIKKDDHTSNAKLPAHVHCVAGSKSNYFDLNKTDRKASIFSRRWRISKVAPVKHLAAALHVDNVQILNGDRVIKISKSTLANLQVIRQVDRKFILVQTDTSRGRLLLCIDQHAADERVRLEQLETDMFGPDGLLHRVEVHDHEPPLRLRLNFKEHETLHHHEELVKCWGFDYKWIASTPDQTFLYERASPDKHDEGFVVLNTTPKVDKRVANADDFRDFLQLLSSAGETYLHSQIRPPVITRLLHSRACRSAIMFGDRLSFGQCKDLIEDLKTCKLPFQCAHGRPSVVPLVEILSGAFSGSC